MKLPVFLLMFATTVSAQSQAVPCGSSSAIAANPNPSARTSPAAAKVSDSQSAKPRPAARDVAAQIEVRRPPVVSSATSCWCGSVGASSLTAQANSQEVPILTGLAGSFRFDHVLLQETRRFSSDTAASLAVGVGRLDSAGDVLSPFSLKSDSAPYNSWYERPTPPQLTGFYDLVLNFKASAPLGDGTQSNFSTGTVAWEVCGYNGTARVR